MIEIIKKLFIKERIIQYIWYANKFNM